MGKVVLHVIESRLSMSGPDLWRDGEEKESAWAQVSPLSSLSQSPTPPVQNVCVSHCCLFLSIDIMLLCR